MKIPTKAIVDLDYAFRGAIHSEFLSEEDEDIQACLEIFKRLSDENRLNLDDSGLPTKKGSELTSSEAFIMLGCDKDAQIPIHNIHEKLLNNNIWIWIFGDIEQHLGIDGKTESSLAQFKREVKEHGFDEITKNPATIKEMLKWIQE
jgi:hypothetical protein